MSATSGGGGSVSEGSEAGGSSQSTMSVSDSPSTSFHTNLAENVTKITLSEENSAGGFGADLTGSKINLSLDERQQKDGIVNVAFDFEEDANFGGGSGGMVAVGFGGAGMEGSFEDGNSGAIRASFEDSSSGAIRSSIGNGSSAAIRGSFEDSSSGAIRGSFEDSSSGAIRSSIGNGSSGAIRASVGNGSSGAIRGSIGDGSSGAVRGSFGDGNSGAIRGSVGGGSSGAIAGTVSGVSSGAAGGGNIGATGGSMGGGSGGDEFKSMNGSEKKDKVPEAVNLELVNMVPYSNGNGTSYGVPVNGIPVKKDSEQVDMSSPYDEYFVPVNEHKKYMRGEKLYVTKDKRRPTSWRRCLSWVVACTVISVVLIVAILAGTGVILSEPNLVKEASVGRNFAGSNMKPSVTDKSTAPTAEMLMYVPRSIESEFVIDNLNFDPALKDVNSTAYQQFVGSMEDQLKMVLFDKENLDFGASDVALKIVNISRDPFKVNYRIGWNYKQGVSNPPEPIKMEDVKKRLVESLARNQGYIDKYHIDREAIKVNHVVNTCQMENGGCSHICYYNYITQRFTCTCPTHLVLDSSGKNCVAWTGSSEDDAVPVPSRTAYPEMPYESTAKPAHENDFGARYEHGVHQGIHHHDENQNEQRPESELKDHEPAAEPEPTAEPSPDHKDGSHFSKTEHDEGIHSAHDAGDYGAAPEPTAEPNSEGKYHGHVHSVFESKESEAEPTPEPAPEPTAEPNSEGKDHIASWHESKDHEPVAEPTPEPAPEPAAEGDSEGRSHDHNDFSAYGVKDHEPAAEPTPEPAPEPTAEPNPQGKDHGHADHSVYESKNNEPAAEPTPEPAPEPNPEPAPESDSKEGKNHDSAVHSISEHEESAGEPTSEPSPEVSLENQNPDHDHVHDMHQHHFIHGFKNEQTPESTEQEKGSESGDRSDHSVHHSKDHEPAAEPTPEPAAEPTAEPSPAEKSHDTAVHSVYNTNHEDKEPAAEPTPEPAPEPTAEPSPKEKDHDHSVHSVYESKDHEPTAEPTPEPAPEPSSEPASESDSKEGKNHGFAVHPISAHEETMIEPTEKLAPEVSSIDQYTVKNSKGQEASPETAQELGSNSKPSYGVNEAVTESSEPAPEPTSKPSADDEMITHFNSGTGEQIGTTIHSIAAHENMNSKSTVTDSQPTSSQGQVTESKTEYPAEIMQNGSVREKSEHRAPHLEDILIRKPIQNLENQNATGHSLNPLDNVERKENGDPVIEEVIIDKSGSHHGHESGSIQVREGPESPENATPYENNTSANRFFPIDQHQSSNTERGPVLFEATTDHPKIVEYSAVDSIKENKNDGEALVQDNSKEKSAVMSNNQDPSQPSQSAQNVGVESVTTSQTNQGAPVTTVRSEIQHESHTIPVTIEFLHPIDGKHEEIHTEMPKAGGESPDSMSVFKATGGNEDPINRANDPGKVLTGNGSDQTKVRETTTELHIAMTTLPPDLVSGNNGQTISGESKETENFKQSQAERGETTKSPEEISNNIKDELLDNEEFNTLINPKEGDPNESTKYPNKPIKSDKKKIKDYVKGDKIEQKGDATPKPAVTPAEFILQKHVNGNENIFDLDYSLDNEHTTKHDGEVTIVDPHGIDVPGVSLKPHGINNHDISVLQTVAPDFRTEILLPNGSQEQETVKSDSKNKEGEFKLEKDYSKFDKDYKYEKQKVSKKKELKKKVNGKDGKNVELDDGRKYYTDITKEDSDVSSEEIQETTMSTLEKVTGEPGTGVKITAEGTAQSGNTFETGTEFEQRANGQFEHGANGQFKQGAKGQFEQGANKQFEQGANGQFEQGANGQFEQGANRQFEQGAKGQFDQGANKQFEQGANGQFEQRANGQFEPGKTEQQSTSSQDHQQQLHNAPLDKSGHLMIDEPTAKSTFGGSSEMVYDGLKPVGVNFSEPEIRYTILNSTHDDGVPGTVFDGMPHVSGPRFEINGGGQNASFVIYENTEPKVVSDGYIIPGVVNSTIHPTIIVNGENDNLQLGHTLRFGNATFFKSGNASIMSILNGTLNHPGGHSFSYFPNGSAVNPTIVVRGQSGTLQGGHEIRFGNVTYRTVLSPETHTNGFRNSNVYRIENGSLPGTVFDGHFNPKEGHYHMFTNASGMYVYTNATDQPTLVIRGQSGSFGNSTGYVIRNNTSSFSNGFAGPHSVIFRNSTVFAVGNIPDVQPHELTSNETIRFTHQMSPSFVSSGTAYKVNDYFGYVSKCAAGQFQCLNGTSKRGSACISLSSKCDSINDCSDGSDELGCIENGCPGNFQCSDSTCLKRNLVCNGILDCSDGSDEKNCENWKCEFDEFQCPSGRCIPVVWQCDNKPDCDNHTDEYNCQTSCGNDEYLCPEGWCIPLTYKCNGVKECSNGEDEQLCDCSHEEFKCQTGGCVSLNQVCNGLEDCPDRSDEWDCVKLEPETNLLKIRSATGNYEPVCADNWAAQYSDEVCTSLGYFSSVPIENENSSSITTETSFYVLKNDTTADFNKKIIVNLRKSDGNCSSGKLVEISCQEFSCGSRSMTDSSSVEARLVGGMSATAGQWPSVALLYNVRNFHSCTANVLTPRWVLASYNCLKMGNKNLNEQDWKFFGGSTVFEAERENAETRKILSIIPHPQAKFNQFLFTNDLALVELDQSLQFTSNLGAVCLPEQEIQPRQICVTAGWGMNTPEDKAIRQQLQYLPVPTMNLTECNSTEHYSGFITDDKICAGYNSPQKSLCYNEEGAPLMCVNDRGEWELQGVLSYHSNCGRGSHPSIFSSVIPVSDWIKKTIGNSFERKALAVTKR